MSDKNNRRLRDIAAGPGTLVSEGCKIEGLVTGRGNYMINGEIEGECDIDGSITVAKSGYCKGVVKANTVIVAGIVDGDIIAVGQVEIINTAKIIGTITGDAIAVAEGAIVEGIMKITGNNNPHRFIEKR
ncbi:MAG: bactofilin family protein, partial [Woeseiales bacterium]